MNGSNAVGFDYLQSIEVDGKALRGIGADFNLGLQVPSCPDWSLRDLLDHVAGASRWMTKCVFEKQTPQERVLPSGPPGRAGLLDWFQQSIDDLLAVLSATPHDELVWTPIKGLQGSAWWRRKAALEVAIHRTDAESTLGVEPEPIDARLALDGIDEYAGEFLPLMLHGVDEPPPVTSIVLSPNDIAQSRKLSLVADGTAQPASGEEVELVATASDLLLWVWNRVPDERITIRGDGSVFSWWKGLSI